MILPPSALHYTLLVVYAVLWAAVTPTFARLRIFALNKFDAGAWARFFLGGLLIANVGPIVSLALLLRVPPVDGFPGVVAGAALGLIPAVFPRFAHAALASNVPLRKFYSPSEAKDVLMKWDKQWARDLCDEWDRKGWRDIPAFGDDFNRNTAPRHLWAALTVVAFPLATGLLIAFLARVST